MKKKRILYITIGIIVFGVVLSKHLIHVRNLEVQENGELKKKLESIMSANISIIGVEKKGDIKGYSSGASGVIVKKKNDTYYAITAYHVIAGKDYCLAVSVFDETLNEYRKKNNVKPTEVDGYYSRLNKIKVEYSNEESDLAIISFKSEMELKVASVSKDMFNKGDRIVTVGTQDGVFFKDSYGCILSNKLSKFKTNDGHSENEVIRHNAYLTPGCSGGGVYNEKLELIGINIGAGTNILGKFKYGAMIPFEQINYNIKLWLKKDSEVA